MQEITKAICFYYLPDIYEPGKGYCAYEGIKKIARYPTIFDRWTLHPQVNQLKEGKPLPSVNEDDCKEERFCPRYTPEYLQPPVFPSDDDSSTAGRAEKS